MPKMNIEQNKTAPASQINHIELNNSSLLELSGRNLIRPLVNPKLERIAIIPADETSALAIPTSSEEYNLAATIQKKNPKAAVVITLRNMKIELLYNGSLANLNRWDFASSE